MTNHEEASSTSSTNTPINTTQKSNLINPPAASPFMWITILALALAFAAIMLGSVIWMQFTQFRITHLSFANSLQTQDIQLTTQFANVQQQFLQQQQVNAQMQAALQQLFNLTNNSSTGWSINEAEYLLYLGNVTLQTQHNLPTTISLLQAADHLLADLGNPQLFATRQLIAKNIAALQQVPAVDTAGLYLRLQALNDSVTKLPFLNNVFNNTKQNNIANNTTGSTWQRAWQDTLHTLKQTIIIQHHKQSFKPLLSQSQQRFFYQYLQVLFSHAQTALLQNQSAIYQASLQHLSQLVSTYFVTDNAATQQMLQALQQLAAININPPLPDISDSLNALKAFNHSQLQQDLFSLSTNKQTKASNLSNKESQ